MDIIQERNMLTLAHFIVSTSHHNKALVDWQIAHRMTYSTTRSISLLLHLLPLTSHDLAILHISSEIPQGILKFTLGIFTSEIVYSVKDLVTHSGKLLFKGACVCAHLFGCGDCGTFSLEERLKSLTLWINVAPVVELQVKVEHFIGHCTVLILTPVNDH